MSYLCPFLPLIITTPDTIFIRKPSIHENDMNSLPSYRLRLSLSIQSLPSSLNLLDRPSHNVPFIKFPFHLPASSHSHGFSFFRWQFQNFLHYPVQTFDILRFTQIPSLPVLNRLPASGNIGCNNRPSGCSRLQIHIAHPFMIAWHYDTVSRYIKRSRILLESVKYNNTFSLQRFHFFFIFIFKKTHQIQFK